MGDPDCDLACPPNPQDPPPPLPREVSITYFWVLLIGFALWIAYGIVLDNWFLIVPNAVALTVSAAYDRRGTALPAQDSAGVTTSRRARPQRIVVERGGCCASRPARLQRRGPRRAGSTAHSLFSPFERSDSRSEYRGCRPRGGPPMADKPDTIVLIHGLWMTHGAGSTGKAVRGQRLQGARSRVARNGERGGGDQRRPLAAREARHRHDRRPLRGHHPRSRQRADHHGPLVRRRLHADPARPRLRRSRRRHRSGHGQGCARPAALDDSAPSAPLLAHPWKKYGGLNEKHSTTPSRTP